MSVSTEKLVEIILEEMRRFNHAVPDSLPAESTAKDTFAATASELHTCEITVKEASADLRRLCASTAARIGIGRSGPRMTTEALLDFRADHAAARDAVLKDVDTEVIQGQGLFSVQTMCRDMNEFLTRPDLGRILDEAAAQQLKKTCVKSPDVQVFAAGGLSAVAIEANLHNILPAITDSLTDKGIRTGTPFYVKYGRVGVEDHVSVLLDAAVVCVLIGERPGLMTAESMSAYIAYRAAPDMPESRRTVVSNIHKDGTPAAEAGAFVADLIAQILAAKKSGVDFQR